MSTVGRTTCPTWPLVGLERVVRRAVRTVAVVAPVDMGLAKASTPGLRRPMLLWLGDRAPDDGTGDKGGWWEPPTLMLAPSGTCVSIAAMAAIVGPVTAPLEAPMSLALASTLDLDDVRINSGRLDVGGNRQRLGVGAYHAEAGGAYGHGRSTQIGCQSFHGSTPSTHWFHAPIYRCDERSLPWDQCVAEPIVPVTAR